MALTDPITLTGHHVLTGLITLTGLVQLRMHSLAMSLWLGDIVESFIMLLPRYQVS